MQRWASERVGRGKLLLRCCLLNRERRFGANRGRERRVHIVAADHLQLVYINSVRGANRLWGDTSMGRNAHGAKRLWGEISFHGAKCPWGEKSINHQQPAVYRGQMSFITDQPTVSEHRRELLKH